MTLLKPSLHDVERRQSRICHDCRRTGPEVLFSTWMTPHRCDGCLDTPRYRARLYGQDFGQHRHQPRIVDLTIGDWLDLLREHKYRCAYCGRHALERPLTRDHVIAISSGGDHTKANVVPACRPCNCHKATLAWSAVEPTPEADLED